MTARSRAAPGCPAGAERRSVPHGPGLSRALSLPSITEAAALYLTMVNASALALVFPLALVAVIVTL